MIGAIALCAAAGLSASSGGGDHEELRDLDAEGRLRAKYEIVRDDEGRQVLDGEYELYYPDGRLETKGRYLAGERHGTWESWYPDGGPRSKGKYLHDFRSGRWICRDPDGEVDAAESGEFEVAETRGREGTVRSRGETRDRLRHGRWIFYWPSGAKQAEGEFENAWPQGAWRFWHLDGTLDPSWISGMYVDGRWTAPLPDSASDVGGAIALERLPELDPSADGPRALWLNRLRANDPVDEERSRAAVEAIAGLEAKIARGGFGVSLDWSPSTSAEDVARNRLTILRLFSYDALMRESPEAWWIDHASGVCRAEPARPLFAFQPRLFDASYLAPPAAPAPYRNRPSGTSRRKSIESREKVSEAVDAALEWLVAHQERDGHWDADEFWKLDPPEDRCEGRGQPEFDVGVTGLAALALLANGNTTCAGPHQEPLARALGWLIRQQDAGSGLVGARWSTAFLYDHAIATLALCEASAFSRNERLRDAAVRGVAFVQRARNPYGAWHYSEPPNGDNDTSVTGWMVSALEAATFAGIDVRPEALRGARAWIDEVSDQATGRVGYDSVGSTSSRVPTVNDKYPVDKTEGLTAVGLYCRFLLGQDPDAAPVMTKHADLMLKALPEWDPDGLTNDACYWFYGSQAMYQMGGKHWDAWRRTVRKALFDSQRKDGRSRGSWDPIGPWGWAGGRVATTAFGALALEAPFRTERLREVR